LGAKLQFFPHIGNHILKKTLAFPHIFCIFAALFKAYEETIVISVGRRALWLCWSSGGHVA
jgi:hypothetical protein